MTLVNNNEIIRTREEKSAMRFQPGQSGNPAGRPPGSRNKETVAREEELARKAAKAAESIVFFAGRGDAVAMRIVAEWARPSGTNRSPGLELPPITCSDDAQVALDTVLVAFGDGALTSRELPIVLGGVERAVRIADRIQQMREREREGRQIRGELHPSMLPKPTGVPDPVVEALRAAGEEVPDYLAAASDANVHNYARLYSPVNSSIAETSGQAAEASPAGSEPSAAGNDGLYFPVNSNASAGDEPPPGAADAVPPCPASRGSDSGELQGDAAVDDKLEAGDVAALIAREIDGGPGDVEGVAAEAHGHLAGAGGPHLLEPAGGVSRGEAGGMGDHGGLHQLAQDRVDADALGRDLDRGGAGEMGERGPAGVVAGIRQPGVADRGDRGDVDDRAAALRRHDRDDVLHREKCALEVEGEHAVPLGLGQIDHAAEAGDADVVVEHVDAAVGVAAGRDHGGDVGAAGDVGAERARLAALALDDGRGLFGSREVHVRAEYLGALAREGDGGRLAVAPARAD